MDGRRNDGNLVIRKKLVSEEELDERCKRRRKEWEKVPEPEDAEGCPEETCGPQSLCERLQEQKDRKQGLRSSSDSKHGKRRRQRWGQLP
uniref:FAM192A/Fyv6 N-terminal domain-containing protein n=1 Tax=Sciurus vulgaris TaxID=55149 RepID=A0A8D2DND3_SCIVU